MNESMDEDTTRTFTYIHTDLPTYLRTYVHTYIHIYSYVYIYIYTDGFGKEKEQGRKRLVCYVVKRTAVATQTLIVAQGPLILLAQGPQLFSQVHFHPHITWFSLARTGECGFLAPCMRKNHG